MSLCRDNGGRVYEPMSNDFTNDQFYMALIDLLVNERGTQAECWLGIVDNSPNDDLANDWIYSSSENPVTTFNWKVSNNQPRDGDGNCAYFKGSNGQWFNGDCGQIRNFVCEFGTLFCILKSKWINITLS